MTYDVHLSRQADSYLARLALATQRRMTERLREIERNADGPETKALPGASGMRTFRIGDFRIVFEVNDVERTLSAGRIGPRGQVYRRI